MNSLCTIIIEHFLPFQVPVFSDAEYNNHLTAEGWTRAETDHLLELCGRFDIRFPVIHDRWDRNLFKTNRTIEDLKGRYYGLCEKLETLHADPSKAGSKPFHYDVDHEKRRKEQLKRLCNRTAEEVEEEEMLRADLKKLIAQADSTSKNTLMDKKALKKKMISANGSNVQSKSPTKEQMDTGGIKFPDFKASGVYLRSQKMKLPPSV